MAHVPATMIPDARKSRVGTRGAVVISAMAVLLVAAASEHDANWDRLRSMPPEVRDQLLGRLRKFDLELSPDQQSAVRELDRRLSELSPEERGRYLAVLRRYHEWLNSLPENRQGEIEAKPPGERMALVRKFLRERPATTGDTPPIMRVVEPGEYSPFELASAYKIWQALDAGQRAQVEKKAQERVRREALFRLGQAKKKIPRETLPDDFDEEKWIALLQDQWPQARPLWSAIETVKGKADEAAKKELEEFRQKALRRQAINLYVSRAEIRPVDPERLNRFIASLPEWLQASILDLPPDEARRRASFAYRLVFPFPEEIGAAPKPAGSGTKAQAARVPAPRPPAPAKRKAAPAGPDESPF
jgi:hypothetical protein